MNRSHPRDQRCNSLAAKKSYLHRAGSESTVVPILIRFLLKFLNIFKCVQYLNNLHLSTPTRADLHLLRTYGHVKNTAEERDQLRSIPVFRSIPLGFKLCMYESRCVRRTDLQLQTDRASHTKDLTHAEDRKLYCK